MSEVLRLGLVVLFLLLSPASFVVGGWGAIATTNFDLSSPPDMLRGWIEDEVAPRVLRVIQPDAYLLRYRPAGEESPASVYVAFYSGYGSTGAHDPAVCYPSQGWELSQVGYSEVPLPGGESLIAQLFRATQGRAEQLVLYWFQPAERWSRGYPEEMLLRVYDAIAGRKQYAFVLLSVPLAGPQEAEIASARELLSDLARDLAPWVRGVVDGESGASPSGRLSSSTESGARAVPGAP